MRTRKGDSKIVALLIDMLLEGSELCEVTPDSSRDPKELFAYREIARVARQRGVVPIPRFYVIRSPKEENSLKQQTGALMGGLKAELGRHSATAMFATQRLIHEFNKQELTAEIEHDIQHLVLGHIDKTIRMNKSMPEDGLADFELRRFNKQMKRGELEADAAVAHKQSLISALNKHTRIFYANTKRELEKQGCPENLIPDLAKALTRTKLEETHPSDYKRRHHAMTRVNKASIHGRT